MDYRRGAALAAGALVLCSILAAETSKPVRTQSGMVQGAMEDGLTVYKGIPFAAPPVGDLRWRAPLAPAAWTGVRDASNFARSCIQAPVVARDIGMDPVETSEDCLYLNIWSPAKAPNDRLPVMVWIYGGGFSIGSTTLSLYNGANIAKKGVLVVSLAYRVGPLGFMAHEQLSAEQGGHSGNYGLLDQIAGLQWVKRNIGAFGGDPNRVTIFGAASPLAKGLFQGAISESGGNFAPVRKANEGGENMDPLATGEKNGAAFLAKMGVTSIAEARMRPADDILKNTPPGLGGGWPIIDGYVLTGDQYKLYEAGRYHDTPILIGTNSDEGALFVPTVKADAYQAGVRSGYGEYAGKILAAYPGATDAEALRSARDLFRDTTFAWPTWTWARLQARTGKGKVFVYYFTHRPAYPDTPQYKGWGASHAGELSYVFGNFTPAMPAAAADRTVSETIESYWVNFAKTGDPNGTGLPQWPAFTKANAQFMQLDEPAKAIPVPNLDKLEALDGYYAWRRSQAEK